MISLLLAGTLAAAAAVRAEDPVPFAEFAKAFLKEHGNAKAASDLPYETLRATWYVRARLGGLDVAFPSEFLADKDHIETAKAVCTDLLEFEAMWADWLAAEPAQAKPVHEDVAALKAWVKSWKPASFAHLPTGERMKDNDLFAVLKAGDEEKKASERLQGHLCTPDLLGVAPKEGQPIRILFSPTRRDFVELMAYVGELDPEKRAELWTRPATEFTTFWIGWDLVVAMEYPPWAPDPGFKTGLPMSRFDKNGVEQHAVQQVANAWQWACYGDDGAPYLHQAVAMNLAIGVCGELNALEGDGWGYGTTGAKTQPYEKFVPGGMSSGGVLPPMPAAGQDALKKGNWREGFGKDHFAAPLRKGQKNGAKAPAKSKAENLDAEVESDKRAHFLLVSEDESTKYAVSAPFLGAESKSKPYPPVAVLVDYREFFRAYKSAFFHWLRTASDPKDPAASAAKFRELLRKSVDRDASQPFDELVQSVYGLPLSAKNGKTDSLEWRFLEWLSGGK